VLRDSRHFSVLRLKPVKTFFAVFSGLRDCKKVYSILLYFGRSPEGLYGYLF
jgi:hypothetical protein